MISFFFCLIYSFFEIMDWEYMEAHTEQLDRYLHALYYIGSYQPPEKEAEIAKITRKLSSGL